MKTPIALALTLAASAAFAQDVYNVDKVHSEVGFRVRHFVSKVSGRFDDFSGTISVVPGKPAASSVEFTIKTASINTANTGRDNHLRSADFFDAEKHPEITFKSTKIVPVDADTFNVTGVFTMHGTAKELTIPVDFGGTVTDARGTEKAGFALTTKLNRKDYGIVWNQTLDSGSMVLGDEVEITVNIEANKRKPAPADAPAAK
ncbi:MAG TPA: YceI family protein [Vicinamibacteria bacterium]|nr:YceI family protein [Vicinamibacteria bacterium]HRB11779.1 YceI family protein [Vicinamibacteria bacterium]